jgi:hypothetical protein
MDPQRQRLDSQVAHPGQARLATKVDAQPVESMLLAADLRGD